MLISPLWVDCLRLPYGRITCGICCGLTLFTQDMSALIWFCVAPVSAMPYIRL